MSMNGKIETLIGLEVHVRLDTGGKIFCPCRLPSDMLRLKNRPNSRICPVCIGHPGSLPHLQPEVRTYALALALALGATRENLNFVSRFDRKHYFYPDLPTNYQVTQHDEPFCGNMTVAVPHATNPLGDSFHVDLERIHLEQDAGRWRKMPQAFQIDFNRSGAVLAEIVTKPCLNSSERTVAFLEHLQRVIQWHGLGTGKPEAGDFRTDVNVSVRWEGDPETPNWKKEIKNIARIGGVGDAIRAVQTNLSNQLRRKERFVSETLGWEADRNRTVVHRDKEEKEGYWYYPDPDLQPFEYDEADVELSEAFLRTDLMKVLRDFHAAEFDPPQVLGAVLKHPVFAFLLHYAVQKHLPHSGCRALTPLLKALEVFVATTAVSDCGRVDPWEYVSQDTLDLVIDGLLASDSPLTSDQLKVLTVQVAPTGKTKEPWIRKSYRSLDELREQVGIATINSAAAKEQIVKLLHECLKNECYASQRNQWLKEKNERLTNFFQGRVMAQLPSAVSGQLVRSILADFFRRETKN